MLARVYKQDNGRRGQKIKIADEEPELSVADIS